MITKLFELYLAFFKIGITTFGGGYAMLPIIEREVVDKKKWATNQEILDYYAIGQCTPGVIAVNTATLVGKKTAGIWGGILATLGVVTPAVIIISIISAFINNFAHIPAVIHAFSGIRVAVCALMINIIIKLIKTNVKDVSGIIIFLLVFIVGILFDLSPVYFTIASAIAGIIICKTSGKDVK